MKVNIMYYSDVITHVIRTKCSNKYYVLSNNTVVKANNHFQELMSFFTLA